MKEYYELRKKYSEFDNVHSNFFTLFKKEVFIKGIKSEDDLGASFKHNLESVISILNIPVTLSVSRSKHYIFDQIHNSELILSAPMPGEEDLFKSKEEYERTKEKKRRIAYETALKKYNNEIKSAKGGRKFWEITFTFLNDCYNSNDDLKLASEELLKQGTVLLWSVFEVLARDFVKEILNSNPDKFKDFDIKSVPVEILELYQYDIKNHLGDIFAAQHDWSNLGTIKKSIERLYPENNTLNKALKDEVLWKLNQRRHLIVHRRGIVDSKYKKSTSDKFKIGKEIPILPTDIITGLETVKSVGNKILDTKKKTAHKKST